MKDSICVFLDSNVFLQFPQLKELDWKKICDSQTVQLVVCITVIHELDAKKNDSRLGKRAERAIKEIRDAVKSGEEIRKGVSIRVYNKEIRASDFLDTLSPDSADDRIVHLARLFKEEFSNTNVAIVTNDYGMELRAESGDICVIHLDSSLRLENPQDEKDKKYKAAVRELNTIKNRYPKLSLGLSLPEEQIKNDYEVVFELSNNWDYIDVESELEKIKSEHPKRSTPRPSYNENLNTINLYHAFISPEALEKYNQKLDSFYEEYRNYLELSNLLNKAKGRLFEFELWIENSGNGLANDVDVLLLFPTVVTFAAIKESKEAEPLEKGIQTPTPPDSPTPFSQFNSNALVPRFPISSLDLGNRSRRILADEWSPDTSVIKNERGEYQIRSHVGKVKHGHETCLGKFLSIYSFEEEIKHFKAEYAISTSDLIDKTEGSISFMIQ